MAILEFINFTPMRQVSSASDWQPDPTKRPISGLPVVFWEDGSAWNEANLWALDKLTSLNRADLKTAKALMKHLAAYASWLEHEQLDWRHFPMRMADRALVRFRGELMDQIKRGNLRPSTANARMRALIQFYRFADSRGYVVRTSPMWQDKAVVLKFFDAAGFQRAMTRVTTDLSIRNRPRPGLRLEDGLLPLRPDHRDQLLQFTQAEQLDELTLMLRLGFSTGARFGTIQTLRVGSIEHALEDGALPGLYRVSIGPGTQVKTKFDVSGHLLLPSALRTALLTYAYSTSRLLRQDRAAPEDRGLLFLTVRGNRYGEQTFTMLMSVLRRRALQANLAFMGAFKFHQTRATFGTQLMTVALQYFSRQADAIAFVRDAMLHKHEATTLKYIKFLEQEPIKERLADEFTATFAGAGNRNCDNSNA